MLDTRGSVGTALEAFRKRRHLHVCDVTIYWSSRVTLNCVKVKIAHVTNVAFYIVAGLQIWLD